MIIPRTRRTIQGTGLGLRPIPAAHRIVAGAPAGGAPNYFRQLLVALLFIMVMMMMML